MAVWVERMTGTDSARSGARHLSTVHLFLLLPWIAVAVGARQTIKDNSFLWHVRAGTLQLDSGEVLRTDPFTFTFGGQPWRTQSWLADLAYGTLERWFGHELGWVSWMNIVVFAATLSVMAVVMLRSTRSVPATAVSLFLLGWLAIPYINPRPVAASYLALAVLIAVLHRGIRWAIPLLLWIWAALHGSFVLGIGLVVLESLRRRDTRLGRAAGLSVLTSSLTAHGLAVWVILGRFAQSSKALDLITEWRPPDLLTVRTIPYVAMIVLVLVGASRATISPRDLWVVAPFLVFGLTSSRAVFVGAIVVSVHLARTVADLVGERLSDRRAGPPKALLGVLAGAMLALPFVLTPGPVELDPERFPLDASQALEPLRTFHDDRDGGFLIFDAWPEVPVFIDDRAELFGFDFLEQFNNTRGAVPDWEDFLDSWEIEQVLVRPGAQLAGVSGGQRSLEHRLHGREQRSSSCADPGARARRRRHRPPLGQPPRRRGSPALPAGIIPEPRSTPPETPTPARRERADGRPRRPPIRSASFVQLSV